MRPSPPVSRYASPASAGAAPGAACGDARTCPVEVCRRQRPSAGWTSLLALGRADDGAPGEDEDAGDQPEMPVSGKEPAVNEEFPAARPRRLRRTAALRQLAARTTVRGSDLVLPLFVKEGISE